MSDQEQTKLMLQRIASKLDEHCEYTKTELSTIKRGGYGDPHNKVPGLMDRQMEDEKRIKALEEAKKQEDQKRKIIIGIGTAVIAALQAIGVIIYELLFNKN